MPLQSKQVIIAYFMHRLKSIGMNPSDYPKIQKLALEIEDSIFLRQAVAKLVAYRVTVGATPEQIRDFMNMCRLVAPNVPKPLAYQCFFRICELTFQHEPDRWLALYKITVITADLAVQAIREDSPKRAAKLIVWLCETLEGSEVEYFLHKKRKWGYLSYLLEMLQDPSDPEEEEHWYTDLSLKALILFFTVTCFGSLYLARAFNLFRKLTQG